MTVWAVLLLAAGLARGEVSAGAGATATAGSEGYRSLAVFADADWEGKPVQPYAWGNLFASRDSRRFTAVGGASKALERGWRVNGGAGFTLGKIVDTGSNAGALILEAGAEKKLERAAAGAGWQLSAGRLGSPTAAPAEDRRRRRSAEGRSLGRGRRPADEALPTETYNELSGYLRLPVSKARLTLRLAAGFPSYGERVITETASVRFPITEPLSVSTGLTLEQSDENRVYGFAGFYYLFD